MDNNGFIKVVPDAEHTAQEKFDAMTKEPGVWYRVGNKLYLGTKEIITDENITLMTVAQLNAAWNS